MIQITGAAADKTSFLRRKDGERVGLSLADWAHRLRLYALQRRQGNARFVRRDLDDYRNMLECFADDAEVHNSISGSRASVVGADGGEAYQADVVEAEEGDGAAEKGGVSDLEDETSGNPS